MNHHVIISNNKTGAGAWRFETWIYAPEGVTTAENEGAQQAGFYDAADARAQGYSVYAELPPLCMGA